VLADGEAVGRIYEDASASTPPELRWFWSITAIWRATRGVTRGHAATREQAMAKFRARGIRLAEVMMPANLDDPAHFRARAQEARTRASDDRPRTPGSG